MKNQYMLSLSCASVVMALASIAKADDCPPLTYDVCVGEGFFETPCGSGQQGPCRGIVADEVESRIGQDPTQKFYRSTGVAERATPTSPLDPPTIQVPGAVGPYGYSKLVEPPRPNPTQSRHPEFESDGTAVHSCREYVYKRFYDYNRLEDAILGYGDDYEGIFALLISGTLDIPRMPGRTLRDREGQAIVPQPSRADGSPIVPGPPPEKNPYFSSWPVVLDGLRAMADPFDVEFQGFVDRVESRFLAAVPYTSADPWAWNETMHRLLSDHNLSPQAHAFIDTNNARYRAIALDYASQVQHGHGAGAGSGFCDEHDQCDIARMRVALAERLRAELDRFSDDSCLEPANGQCDWTSRNFGVPFLGLYPQRESEFTRCVNISGTAETFGPEVPQTSIRAVDSYLTDRLRAQDQQFFNTPWMAPETGRPTNSIGWNKGNDDHWGWDAIGLSAGYDYNYGFSVYVPSGRTSTICQLGAEAHANGRIWGQAPVAGRFDLIQTNTTLALNPGGGGHFHSNTTLIGGTQLYDPIDTDFQTSADWNPGRRFQLVNWDMYYPILFFTIHVGVAASATVGLSIGASFSPGQVSPGPEGTCDPRRNLLQADAHATPSAGIDVEVTVGVGIVIAELGIEGGGNLITVALPVVASARLANNQIILSESLKVAFGSGGGRIDASAKVGICPFCKKASMRVVSWEGKKWDVPITDERFSRDLPGLQRILQ